MTPDERLDRYARLAVEVAVNLQPGQFLRIAAEPEHLPLVRAIGRVAYERGARYVETLAIVREGLSHDHLTYAGRFHSFENLPMYLRPLQKPYPSLWYMRNPVTAAMEGMHTILVGSLEGLASAVPRYQAAWEIVA